MPIPPISDDQLEAWFTYHAPGPEDPPKYQAIRDAAKNLARTMRDNCPACPDTTAAIRKVREAVMTANAAIACKGQ